VDGYFRLDVAEEVLLQPSQAADGRAKFLHTRWDMGPAYYGLGGLEPRQMKMSSKEVQLRGEMFGTELRRPYISAPLDDDMLADEAVMLIGELRAYEVEENTKGELRGRKDPLLRMFGRTGVAGRDTTSTKLNEREKAIVRFALTITSRATARAKVARNAHLIKTEDVVRDLALPTFRVDFSGLFASWFAPARRFGPVTRKAQPVVNHPKSVLLTVTVIKAINLPQREEDVGGGGGAGLGIRSSVRSRGSALLDDRGAARDTRRGGDEEFDDDEYGDSGGRARRRSSSLAPTLGRGEGQPASRLMPFVEINFQGRSVRSASVSSSAGVAVWNDQLVVPFQLPNSSDFSPSAMAECRDEIVINIFDKVIRDNKPTLVKERHDGGEKLCIHWEKRLLGTLRLTVGALYRLMEVSGTFDLEVPTVLPGYTPMVSSSSNQATLPSLATVISFSPLLETQAPSPEEEPRSLEAEDITQHAYKWLEEILSKHRRHCQRRYIRAMAVDATGRASLLCRYMGASFDLPEGYDHESDRAAVQGRIARMVSLVPFVHDNDMRRSRHDVWTTCAKLLELGVGDGEEHALLLAGYFRKIGLQCYIVLGTSLMEAEATWVLTGAGGRNADDNYQGDRLDAADLGLWDPRTGRCYSTLDPACPMREVGTIFDNANIWANIQNTGNPSQLKWDLTSASLWKPFFGPQCAFRSIRTLQQPVTYETIYRRDHSLGKNFYDGLEKRAESSTLAALRDLRRARLMLPTDPATHFGRDFLHRNFFASRERLQELEDFFEAAGRGGGLVGAARSAQAAVAAKLCEAHNAALRSRPGITRILEDFQGYLFCLPMTDSFHSQVFSIIDQSGFASLPRPWTFTVAAHAVMKRVPYVCAIWVYIAAVRGR